ncbi:MAG: protein-glutamate O-methyltransferase CheR [Polyangiaceae bacterium]
MTLSPQVFAIVAHLIEEQTGLHYNIGDIDLLAEKLSDRTVELGLASLLDYYYFLRYDEAGAAELNTLAQTLVVHETYFFREYDGLRVMIEAILPEILRDRSKVRIWSTACATGEEPYTIAIMLAAANLLDRVEIVGSDLSERALSRARAGIYGGRSFRVLPEAQYGKFFVEDGRGSRHVRDDLRGRIEWRRINLMDGRAISALGIFDLVVCRNVLIYFSDATVGRVAASLRDALVPGGLLLIGASESLLRFGNLFDCEERSGAFFYRKPRL